MIAAFLFSHWRALGALALVLMLAGYIETLRLERDHAYKAEANAKAELATFKAEVAAIGRKAEAEAKAREAADKQTKETADAENAAALDTLARTIARLRNRPRGDFVPAAASPPASPDRATFDRAELERAIRSLDTGVQGLVDEGSAATVKLDTARRWGLKLSTTMR